MGRGSLAGPVTVGAVMVLPGTPTAPTGVRDSKDLTPSQRERLEPRIRQWAPAFGVGHASPVEIDTVGLMSALRLAAVRALLQLGRPVREILLDGSHDWLSCGDSGMAEYAGSGPVRTRVKADRDCASVAAASVLAKVERDRIMADLAGQDDRYGWRSNKGYAAPGHLTALAADGPSVLHRLSWQLPSVSVAALDILDPDHRRTWRRFADGEQLIMLEPVPEVRVL